MGGVSADGSRTGHRIGAQVVTDRRLGETHGDDAGVDSRRVKAVVLAAVSAPRMTCFLRPRR